MADRRWRRLLSRVPRGWPRFGVPKPVSADPWAWLEPYPGPPSGPAPNSLSIAYVSALQRLPPDQRAALLLTDVLEFDLAEVADILDCDIAEAGHLLRRARSAMPATARAPRPASAPPPGDPGAPGDPCAPCAPDEGEDAVVARFTGAFEGGDVAAIAALLTPDAWLRMRPLPVAYRGRSAARHFLAVVAFPGGTRGYRLVAIRANGQPAFGCYLRDPAAAVDHACGLLLLTVEGGRIAAIDRFTDNSLLPRFGLPRTLPACIELRGAPPDHDLLFGPWPVARGPGSGPASASGLRSGPALTAVMLPALVTYVTGGTSATLPPPCGRVGVLGVISLSLT